MAALALANALKDFGAPSDDIQPLVAPTAFPAMPDMDLPDFESFPAEEPVDVDALIADAVGTAEAALEERLAQEHADALQAERTLHAGELLELQKQFADDASEKIRTNFTTMETQLLELTGAVTARILGAVLTDDIRQRSIERLEDIIRDALTDNEAIRIRVRGSLPLFDALKEKLPLYAEQFDFAESPVFDLSIMIDDSVFETRLAEWSALLAEALS